MSDSGYTLSKVPNRQTGKGQSQAIPPKLSIPGPFGAAVPAPNLTINPAVIQRQQAADVWTVQPSPARLAPPEKASRPTAANIQALRLWLNAHVAGHALAKETYTFYEVIDNYLGPWGATGYPIQYGKHYNILFTTDKTLMANPATRDWVWKTTILLQETLVDFILNRYIAGNLAQMTEPELRDAAFESHPEVYTNAGLSLVASVAPALIPVIVSIPAVEFSPGSDNFGASWKQAVETTALVLPRVLANLLAAAAGPAHTGSFRRAIAQDQQRFLTLIQMDQFLGNLRQRIEQGEVNNIVVLNDITTQLLQYQFPDQGYARAAREVILLANQRKKELAREFANAIKADSRLRVIYDRQQPGWEKWL